MNELPETVTIKGNEYPVRTNQFGRAILTRYSPKLRVQIEFDPESGRTDSVNAEKMDVNYIVRQAQKNGFMPEPQHPQTFMDVSAIDDFQTAQNQVIAAEEAFMTIPATIRAEFENNPGKFLEFALNPENEEAMRDMGLLNPLPPVAVSDEPPSAEPSESS